MASVKLKRARQFVTNPILVSFIIIWSSIWSTVCEETEPTVPATLVTNPVDLRVLHEMMYALYYDYDWAGTVPDPCVSGPQGIVCEADPETGVLFVTQLQFGYISPIANIIPCAENASIPASIGNLTRLTSLSFYSCFTNQSTTLPVELTLLGPTLRLLVFTQNPALTGPLPPEIARLTGLHRLVISQTALHGAIPATLAALSSLTQLDLSHNGFSGPIPPTLAAMDSLVNLDLRWNSLDGAFPPSLAQGLPNLERLAISHNNLTNDLPDAFTGLQSLTFLDLASNQLSGALPPSLARLVALQDVFLNANRFDGAIPEWLSELRSLVRLDFSSCGFTGVIPESLQRLKSLRFFSVSNNRLSGAIPGSLASLPVIFTLNLDGNELAGPVPFPASFVQKMGRNLQLQANAGLCYNPQLVTIKLLLPELKQCPESVTLAPAPSLTASPGIADAPNTADAASHSSPNSRITHIFFTFVATLILCLLPTS